MKYVVYSLAVVALVVLSALAGMFTGAHAQTVQEQIEKSIGALTVQNMVCASQTMTQAEELRRVKAELDALKAKMTPTTVDPGLPK